MAKPTDRATLITYCKRRLGEPVIEINVDPDQLEDRIDDALQLYREFHSDAVRRAYISYQLTAEDIANEYIQPGRNILDIVRVLPISASLNTSVNFFDVKYQMMLNDIADLQNYAGDLAYYEQMQQYLSLLDMKLNGSVQINYSRRLDRLYIFGDFKDGDLKAGDYIVLEAYRFYGDDTESIYDDMFMKEYATQCIKEQWGANLMKFEGMQLPGGVQFSGRQLYDEAVQEKLRLREQMRIEFEKPVDFFIG